jgi:hypothetical protein
MATIESNLVKKLNRHRGIYSGRPYNVKGRIRLEAGTVLTTGDVLMMVPIGENQRINKVISYITGLLPTATVSIGYHQMLDGSGDPVVVERLGVFGDADTKFESPATNTTAFAAAAVLSTAREVIVPGGGKLAGPVILSATVATGGTVGAGGVEIYIGAEFDGETSPIETGGGTYADSQAYLLDQ